MELRLGSVTGAPLTHHSQPWETGSGILSRKRVLKGAPARHPKGSQRAFNPTKSHAVSHFGGAFAHIGQYQRGLHARREPATRVIRRDAANLGAGMVICAGPLTLPINIYRMDFVDRGAPLINKINILRPFCKARRPIIRVAFHCSQSPSCKRCIAPISARANSEGWEECTARSKLKLLPKHAT